MEIGIAFEQTQTPTFGLGFSVFSFKSVSLLPVCIKNEYI